MSAFLTALGLSFGIVIIFFAGMLFFRFGRFFLRLLRDIEKEFDI